MNQTQYFVCDNHPDDDPMDFFSEYTSHLQKIITPRMISLWINNYSYCTA